MGNAIPRPSRPKLQLAVQAIRRLHLYFGLFLFPWAVLYGVTAFLFNHPTAFSDVPTRSFSADVLVGTPFERRSSARELAEEVIGLLNAEPSPTGPYTIAGRATFTREFAFVTVKAKSQTIYVLVDVTTGSGTVRVQQDRDPVEPVRAPFATGRSDSTGDRSDHVRRNDTTKPTSRDALVLDKPIHERIRDSIPAILERTGFPAGDITVTSVPEVRFPVQADGKIWIAIYNPMTGALSGSPTEAPSANDLSVRRFLLRLHTAHGYGSEIDARWLWALGVDVMAVTICFWGVSGLIMWWQLKAHRKTGLAVLLLGVGSACAIGLAMHAWMTAN